VIQKTLLYLTAIFFGILPRAIFAITPYSIENLGGSVGLGTTNLKNTTINIIQWVLGILALVAVVMIIFSGFIAVTASGEERGETARKVIIGALIGLVIVLLAWAIIVFVAGTTKNVTS
jgi:hypothetical protein